MSGLPRLSSWLGTAVPVLGASTAAYCLSGFNLAEAKDASTEQPQLSQHAQTPSRAEQLAKLQQGTLQNPFDVLVIGGGATGTGCAVDATTRRTPDPPLPCVPAEKSTLIRLDRT